MYDDSKYIIMEVEQLSVESGQIITIFGRRHFSPSLVERL